MTRKLLSMFCCLCLLCSLVPLSAQADSVQTVKATIPSYTWQLNGQQIDYTNSLYPVIHYQGVTYLPMTWGYCEYMGLRAIWVEGEGLFIAYTDIDLGPALPEYETASNPQTVTATVVNYPVYINGEAYTGDYPLLNFRDITYLPMSWQLSHEEFNWGTDWDDATQCFSVTRGIPGDYSGSYEIYDMDADYTYFDRHMVYTYKRAYDEYGNEEAWYYHYEKYYRMDNKTGVLEEMSAPTEALDTNTSAYKWGLKQVHTCSDRVIELDSDNYTTETGLSAPDAYLRIDGERIHIGRDLIPMVAYETADGSVYVNTHWYNGVRGGGANKNQRLYCVSPDGTVQELTPIFPDYYSMTILGRMDDALLLKCEMGYQSEYYPEGHYEISPYNDGYYRFDPSTHTLTRLRRYIKTDLDFITPDGQVYSVIDWKNSIIRTF